MSDGFGGDVGLRGAAGLRRGEGVGLFGLILQAALSAMAFVVAAFTGSRGAYAEGWHLLVGVLPWGILLLHQRLRRQAAEERQDLADLEREKGRPGLFEGTELDSFSARRRLESFERAWAGGLSLVWAAAMGSAGAFLLRSALRGFEPARAEVSAVGAAFMVGVALVAFLVGRYAAGMAAQPHWRTLRAGAGYMLTCAAVSFFVGFALALNYFGVAFAERAAPFLAAAVMLLLSVELVLAFILDIYRPRVPGRERRFPYDSRIAGLLAEPGSLLGTLAHTLDYQFGFHISQTWFYQFMERAIAPLLLFQIGTFYLLSAAVVVGPDEQAIIERFGEPRRYDPADAPPAPSDGSFTYARDEEGKLVVIYGPGIHAKWPWPIERAYRFPASRVHTFIVGEIEREDIPAFLWTREHYKGRPFYLLVSRERTAVAGEDARQRSAAAPVDIVAGSVVVTYTVDNLYDYLYKHADAEATLRSICYRELTRYAASADLMDLIGAGGERACSWLAESIQKEADALKLGVRVVLVGLQDLHPPVPVGPDFEAVVSAQEEKEATILRAKTYSVRAEALAEADAAVRITKAEAYKHRRTVVSKAEADRFASQAAAYEKAPEVYTFRQTMSALEDALVAVRKYVVAAASGGAKTTVIDVQDRAGLEAGALDLIGR